MTIATNKRIAQRRLSRDGRMAFAAFVHPVSGMDRLAATFMPNHGDELERDASDARAIGERLRM